MSSSEIHQARSPEFLSRLHDGELEPAELARFEAHRAHCVECRDAAAQLEEAIAFFRSARPRPAAPDLSARILRKLRAASPGRRVFGRVFGIDLRWAGAFAAALLAVIVGSSIVIEHEARERRAIRDLAVPVLLQEPRATAPSRGTAQAPAGDFPAREKATAPPRPERPLAFRKELKTRAQNEAKAPAPAAPEASAPSSDARGSSPAPEPRVEEGARRKTSKVPVEAEDRTTAVGAGARPDAVSAESAAPAAADAPVPRQRAEATRIRVIASDGQEPPPEISNLAELSLSPTDRGEYAVTVRPDGSVASVRPLESSLYSRRAEDTRRHASEELRKLRFAAADRPRELILKVGMTGDGTYRP